jgi:ribosomal protein S11
MEKVVRINFTSGELETGFIHINENNEIVMFTDENGNELLEYSSWYVSDEQ